MACSAPRFTEKVILVAGGAGGIGSEICRCLAAEAALVICADRSGTRGSGVVSDIQRHDSRAYFLEPDATSSESWARAAGEILGQFHRLQRRPSEHARFLRAVLSGLDPSRFPGTAFLRESLLQLGSEAVFERGLELFLEALRARKQASDGSARPARRSTRAVRKSK